MISKFNQIQPFSVFLLGQIWCWRLHRLLGVAKPPAGEWESCERVTGGGLEFREKLRCFGPVLVVWLKKKHLSPDTAFNQLKILNDVFLVFLITFYVVDAFKLLMLFFPHDFWEDSR